jgi:tetratricopeptide (TPR) repeat protein
MAGWFWFLVTLLPMIGLVQVGGQAMADRYMSLPLVGIALAVVWGLDDLTVPRPSWRPPLVAAGIAVLGLLTVLTSRQVGFWLDCESLFSRALSVTDDNWMMHLNLGNCLSEKGRRADAAREYAEAVRIRPRLAAARNNYALELAALGRTDEAFAQYRAALSLEPDYADALIGLGLLLAEKRNARDAATLFRRVLVASPGRADAHRYLARLLDAEGKRFEALSHYREAARLESARRVTHAPRP